MAISRPSFAVWMATFAFGCGVIAADIRADIDRAEVARLQARVAFAEAQARLAREALDGRCFIRRGREVALDAIKR